MGNTSGMGLLASLGLATLGSLIMARPEFMHLDGQNFEGFEYLGAALAAGGLVAARFSLPKGDRSIFDAITVVAVIALGIGAKCGAYHEVLQDIGKYAAISAGCYGGIQLMRDGFQHVPDHYTPDYDEVLDS